MGIDHAVDVLQEMSQVTLEESYPAEKAAHDKAVLVGAEPYDWAGPIRWPKVSADRVKMQIIGHDKDKSAAFYISYDS